MLTEDQAQSLVGRQLGPYKVLSLLGAGGMGKVYLAQDTRLGRTIALKILPADLASDRDRVRRLIREAKAASALKHPNVAAIYEIGDADGVSFIAMEYVEGQTLAAKISGRPLDTAEIVEVSLQLADALDEAHSKRITHRDIKPANLMLTPRGQLKVLDFGLAKVTRPEGEAAASDISTVVSTAPGVVMGTVEYMSPEQVLGREVDHRTDIFSLGVVMYEMATGRRPFSGANVGQTIERITHAQPEAMARFNYNIRAELERIVRKCLEKDRERRYQSARDLLVDLSHLKRNRDREVDTVLPSRRRRPHTAIHSLAVLPLVNASADPNAEYLSDGVSESIINSLSQLPRLRVMARSTVFRYKGREVDPQEVGRALGVRAVLTGRVLQVGDKLVIRTELVDAADGSQLWGEQYSRKLSDLFAVQEEISQEISGKLRLRLSREEKKRLTKRYTENTEAYQLYLKGSYYWNKSTEDGLKKGIEYFNQSLEKDPNYALAYTGLADSYVVLGMNYLPPKEAFPKAKAYAAKALELNETLAEAHAAVGAIRLLYDWQWLAAESGLKRALDLKPNYAIAHHLYSYYLAAMGRIGEAIGETKRALELDPLSLGISTNLGVAYYLARQYDQAIEQHRKTLEMDPNYFFAHLAMGQAYGQKRRYEEAIAELNKANTLSGGWPDVIAELGYAYAASGQRGEMQKMLQELRERARRGHIDPVLIALTYSGLSEKNQAFTWLEKAYAERSPWIPWLKVEPKWDSLRADPRFADLLRRVGLTP